VPHRYLRFPFPASKIALALWSIKVLREYYSLFLAALFIGLRKRVSPDLVPHATIITHPRTPMKNIPFLPLLGMVGTPVMGILSLHGITLLFFGPSTLSRR